MSIHPTVVEVAPQPQAIRRDTFAFNIHAEEPTEVLLALLLGNERFATNLLSKRQRQVPSYRRQQLIPSQHPKVAVLGCADSRVPVEIIFDQALGDIFTTRVAGNALGVTTQGSLEYAVLHLNVRVVLIMGHENCGAIKAAMMPPEALASEPPVLKELIGKITTTLSHTPRGENMLNDEERLKMNVQANAKAQAEEFRALPHIKERIHGNELEVVPAYYDMGLGKVILLEEVVAESMTKRIAGVPKAQRDSLAPGAIQQSGGMCGCCMGKKKLIG